MMFLSELLHSAYLSARPLPGLPIRARLRYAPACPVTQNRRPPDVHGADLRPVELERRERHCGLWCRAAPWSSPTLLITSCYSNFTRDSLAL